MRLTQPNNTMTNPNDPASRWRPVPDFEGRYEVSDSGTIRSLTSGGGIRRTPKIKKPSLNRGGYHMVVLGNRQRCKGWTIHRLVLTAFVGPMPSNIDGCHNNGIRTDNRLENLRWATRAENEADKIAHGTKTVGEKNGFSKLTSSQVRKIRSLEGKMSQREIAEEVGATQQNVSCIIRGKTWSNSALIAELNKPEAQP